MYICIRSVPLSVPCALMQHFLPQKTDTVIMYMLKMNVNHSSGHLYIHPSTFNYLGPRQRNPDLSLPSHLLHTEVFPGQSRDIVSPAYPGSAPGPPPSKAYPEHLTQEVPCIN